MENILIIKTNASGDVLRTTVLLHVLKGNIFWITAAYNFPLFPDRFPGLTLVAYENIPAEIFNMHFDLIINLEEDVHLAERIGAIETKRLTGVCLNNGILGYSDDSAEWFDMSLISQFSAARANELKRKNSFSYQEIVCRMAGKVFHGQPYLLHKNHLPPSATGQKIGIEERVGKRWPNKYWFGYGQIKDILTENKSDTIVFEQRRELRQYMEEIQQCRLIITGDTLAMHISLGYGIPCIAIFNCTSPDEIYDYGILKKIVSPLLEEVFYKTEVLREATEAVSVEEVLSAVRSQLQAIAGR